MSFIFLFLLLDLFFSQGLFFFFFFSLSFIRLFNRTLQIATLQILCGVAKVIEARSLKHRGAFADCLERVRGWCSVSALRLSMRRVLVGVKYQACFGFHSRWLQNRVIKFALFLKSHLSFIDIPCVPNFLKQLVVCVCRWSGGEIF